MEGKVSTSSFDCLQRPLEIPTLIFQGSRCEDRALSDDGVEMLRRILAEPRVVTLPESGHTIHSAQPEAYQRALVEFLDRRLCRFDQSIESSIEIDDIDLTIAVFTERADG